MNFLKWLLIILIALIVLLIIVMATKVHIKFRYDHHNDNDHLKVEIKALFGLFKYKIEMPLIKIDEDSPTIQIEQEKTSGGHGNPVEKENKQYSPEDFLDRIRDFKELLQHVVSFYVIIRKFLRKVSIKEFQWHSVIGIGDAAYTGIFTGALWAIKGGLVGFLSQYIRFLDLPEMSINPSFQHAISQTSISCMFHFRIGHAMVAGLKIIKYWKGGKPKLRSKPLSSLSNDKTKTV